LAGNLYCTCFLGGLRCRDRRFHDVLRRLVAVWRVAAQDAITVAEALELKAEAARVLVDLLPWLAPEDRTGRCLVQTLYLWHSICDWGPLRLLDCMAQERGYAGVRKMGTNRATLAASAAHKNCHTVGLRTIVHCDQMLGAAFKYSRSRGPGLAVQTGLDGTYLGTGRQITLTAADEEYILVHLLKVDPDAAAAYAKYAAWAKDTPAGRKFTGKSTDSAPARFARWAESVEEWEDKSAGANVAAAARQPLLHVHSYSKCEHLGREVWACDKPGVKSLNNLIYFAVDDDAPEQPGNSFWGEAQQLVVLQWRGATYGLVRGRWYRSWEHCPADARLARVRTSARRKRPHIVLEDDSEDDSDGHEEGRSAAPMGGLYDDNEPWVLLRYITKFGDAVMDGWAVSKTGVGYVPAGHATAGDTTYRLILPGGARRSVAPTQSDDLENNNNSGDENEDM